MQPTTPEPYLNPDINVNAFYSCYENVVYICFEKVPSLEEMPRIYNIIRDGKIIATGTGNTIKKSDDSEESKDDLIRPWEFDDDHHTELFKPDTRNWLCFKDKDFNKQSMYVYEVETEGGRHKSRKIVVITT